MRAIGQMTNGVNYHRNGVPAIVQQAVRSVENLYETLDELQTLEKETIKADKKKKDAKDKKEKKQKKDKKKKDKKKKNKKKKK